MKKRLNVFCLLVLLILGVSVYMNSSAGMSGFALGVEAGQTSMHDAEKMKYLNNMVGVSLRPMSSHMLVDSVYNEVTSSYVPATYFRILVGLPFADTPPSVWKVVWPLIYFLVSIVFMVMAIVFFIRLIIAINKSDIFSWKNVYRLYKLGTCLLGIFVMELLYMIIASRQVADTLSIPGYSVRVMDGLSYTSLILGGCALLIAEIFAIGLRLKEEQELTI